MHQAGHCDIVIRITNLCTMIFPVSQSHISDYSQISAHGQQFSTKPHCCGYHAAIWFWMKLIGCWTWALSRRSGALWRKTLCLQPARGRLSCSVLRSPRKFRLANPHSLSHSAFYFVFHDIVQLYLCNTHLHCFDEVGLALGKTFGL